MRDNCTATRTRNRERITARRRLDRRRFCLGPSRVQTSKRSPFVVFFFFSITLNFFFGNVHAVTLALTNDIVADSSRLRRRR